MKKYFSIYIIISIFIVTAAASAFSQDNKQAPEEKSQPAAVVAPKPVPPPVAPAAPVSAPQAKEIAVYGEVQSVNAVNNTLSVQYYDYDSDSEKTVEVAIGADTKMENAKTVSDVKKSDWVDVTYIVSGGKNMAKTVSVEKEESAAEPVADQAATGTSSNE